MTSNDSSLICGVDLVKDINFLRTSFKINCNDLYYFVLKKKTVLEKGGLCSQVSFPMKSRNSLLQCVCNSPAVKVDAQ